MSASVQGWRRPAVDMLSSLVQSFEVDLASSIIPAPALVPSLEPSQSEAMRAFTRDTGPSVAVAAEGLGPREGYLWMIDGNEKDQQAGLACRCLAQFLRSIDIMSADVGSLIVRVDREVLPEASREWCIPGLSASLLIVRVSDEVVTIGHVGEVRARLLDRSGSTIYVSREDNVFSAVPESVWRDQRGYSEESAKQTILAVVGGGTAVPTVTELAQPETGVVFASSHLWHRYRTTEIPTSWAIPFTDTLPALPGGQAAGFLSWGY